MLAERFEASLVVREILDRRRDGERVRRRGIDLERAIDVLLRAGVVLEAEQHLGVQRARVRIVGVDLERGAEQRIRARLPVTLTPPRGAEQRARVERVRVEHLFERPLRLVEVVLAQEQLAQFDLGVGVHRIGRRRAVERFERILEQLRIVDAEVFDRRRNVDELFTRQVGTRRRVVHVNEVIELLHRAVTLAAIVVQLGEVERRGETIRGVVSDGAHERALGGRALAAQHQHFAECGGHCRTTASSRRAARSGLGIVVLADGGIGAREVALRRNPLAVGRSDFGKNVDGVQVLPCAECFAPEISILRGGGATDDGGRGNREQHPAGTPDAARHDLLPSISRIDFAVRASLTSSSSSASS